MTQTYYANGKLLISGEYFILDGAVGLALPTKFGQSLTVDQSNEKGIQWKSLDCENKCWFEVHFNEQLEIRNTTNNEIAERLQSILQASSAIKHNSQITTKLYFPNNWGLGSSSTLISLIAQWTNSNPYELLAKTFGGSGYDIACATAKSAITFQLDESKHSMVNDVSIKNHQLTTVDYRPAFSNSLYFLHLNKKQNSREGIQQYKNLIIEKKNIVEQISALTQKIIHAIELDEFCYYLEVHENIISNSLNLQKAKDIYFSDFPGTIKSLGAWGGDFVLVASNELPEMITHYFKAKGFPTIFCYQDMIL